MRLFLSLTFALFLVQSASAQTASGSRGYVVVNGGYQLTANDFADGAANRENAEDGRFDTTYVVKGGPAFDVAGGGVLWRRLGLGIGISRFSVATPSSLTAAVPHPFFFNQARSIAGDVAGLKREELAVHVQARGVFPIGVRLQVMLFGGPSFFQVKQGVVSGYTYDQSYPYDSASFKAATTNAATASKMGFHAGGDVAFFFTRQIGLGITMQFAGASVELPAAGGAAQKVDVGGGKVGGGLRVRF